LDLGKEQRDQKTFEWLRRVRCDGGRLQQSVQRDVVMQGLRPDQENKGGECPTQKGERTPSGKDNTKGMISGFYKVGRRRRTVIQRVRIGGLGRLEGGKIAGLVLSHPGKTGLCKGWNRDGGGKRFVCLRLCPGGGPGI